MNRTGGSRLLTARRVLAGTTGVGAIGASAWAISNGQVGLAIVGALVGALGVVVKTVVPQNSRDRVEWTRTILNYRLRRGRDQAALRLAQAWLDAGGVQLPQDVFGGVPTTRPARPRRPRPSRS